MTRTREERAPRAKRRLRPIFAGGLVAIGLAASSLASAAGKGDEERLQRILAAFNARDCKTVVKLGAPVLGRQKGSGMTSRLEAALSEFVVICEAELEMVEPAYAHALRATALEESSDYLWRVRLAGELQGKKYEAAVVTVEAMSQGRGAALNAIPVNWMGGLNTDLKKDSPVLRRRLLAVLAQDSYAPDELYGPADGFRSAYARLLAKAGEGDAARAMVERLEDPSALSEAMLDPALRTFVPAAMDLRAQAEKSLVGYREAMARPPDRLAPVIETARTLRALGRPQEALQLLQTISARTTDPKAFEDGGERINWFWDGVARSEAALGHYDEAVAAFRKGASAGEDGVPNVSQVINLAFLQATALSGEEALKTLAVFDNSAREASPYGNMEMRLARGCAHATAGHQAEARAELDYMRAHEADHPEALSDLLLCMGDIDGAAASFIRRLHDDDQRIGALTQLSEYDSPPVPDSRHPVQSRLPAVRARPDVQSAIARAGGIRRFPLQRDEL